jgi:hypothetical protein
MPKITAIELENFQSIGNPTVIPIRDLTLMFGPNGAGKSAVFDAIALLSTLLGDDWGPGSKKLLALLTRNSRNFGLQGAPLSLGLGIQVHIEQGWSYSELDWERISNMSRVRYRGVSKGGDYADQFCERTLRFYARFKAATKAYPDWFICQLDLGLDDELIVSLQGEGSDARLTIYEKDWIDLSALKELPQSEKGIHLRGRTIEGPVETNLFFTTPRLWLNRQWFSDEKTEGEFLGVAQEVIDLFREVIRENLRNVPVVQGSRTVPSVAESIAIVSGTSVEHYDGHLIPPVRIDNSPVFGTVAPILNKCDPIWLELCRAVVSSASKESIDGDENWWELSTISRVNALLRDELFIENAYQVHGEVYCIAGLDKSGELLSPYTEPWPKLVRLYLVDHEQRLLEFEDVGSGIGYVLPVLASLASNDTSLIQQPELHLHPALQSKLGDVIVKSVENKEYLRSFTLIETHSEHLLLRVMRLIRTAKEREDEVLRPLSHDQVAVLYFEPQPSGETRIRRLRLSPDGQLIDRWPGGFFNERLRDVFDE